MKEQSSNNNNNMDKELLRNAFMKREYEQQSLPYQRELSFYNAVKTGDLEQVKSLELPLKSEGLGHLSDDPIRNVKYHLIITIALISRFCIEGGLEIETAYSLSDLYIQKADKCSTEIEIEELHRKVILDFTKKMKQTNRDRAMSKPIVQAIDYIQIHLHEQILICDIASATGLNDTYLCTLFKKEMKISLASYIRSKRIELAQNLLKFSDYAAVDISNYLAFSSHSHFISVFKKETGMTPREYRNQYFSTNWRVKKE